MFVLFLNGRYVLLAVLVCSIIVDSSGQILGPFAVNDPFRISRVVFDPSRSRLAPDHVFGARECGGTGKVLETRHGNCHSTKACYLVVGRKDDASVVFVPNENINDVVIRGTVVSPDGKFTTTDVPLPGVNLIAGQTYQLTTSGLISSEIEREVTGRVEIFSQRNYRRRTCLEANYFIGSVPSRGIRVGVIVNAGA